MASIFISYRRKDSDFWVSRLVEELGKHFPPHQVFQDIASIEPGADFRHTLDEALASTAVTLVVIGHGWLSATDNQGCRRLDLPGDFVRQEIAESLRRREVRVIPILVNGAEMPVEGDLPEPLRALYLRQAFELTVRHWHKDVAELVQMLKRVSALSEERGVDQESAPQKTEDRAKLRGAEARAAQEEIKRSRVEERARQKTLGEEVGGKSTQGAAHSKAAEDVKHRAAQKCTAVEAAKRPVEASLIEIKATIPERMVAITLKRFGLSEDDGEERHIYFFDTPALDLFEAGISASACRVVGGIHYSAIKLRPVNPEQIPERWRRCSDVKIEADASEEYVVKSATFSAPVARGMIKRVVAGEAPIASLFSQNQKSFLLSMTGGKVDFSLAVVMGPLRAQLWRFEDPGCPWPVTAELWRRADGATRMEASIKAPSAQGGVSVAAFMAFLAEVGVERDNPQQAKTRWALSYYAPR